jgi:PleD family two-component response regulator
MANSASAILRRFRNVSMMERVSSCAAVPAFRQPAALIPVLLASALESDCRVMRDLLDGTQYLLVHAANWNRALNFMSHVVVPIILYDRLFDINDWQLAVKRLISTWRSPSVVLLSQTSEHDLRDDFVSSGGFEVLLRPLESGNVLQTLDLALTYYSLPTPRRQQASFPCIDLKARS